jgi:hypothetical protein
MRLPRSFYRLPRRFDVSRLQAEVVALPPDAWAPHPNGDAGNFAVRLISVDGTDNDEINGTMRMTAHLERSPYLRQVLTSFDVVFSRSRLLKLAPGAVVPTHADIHHHWFFRVRLHIPILTRPEVRFTCDGESVHMAAGEAWIFDNWRLHRVENASPVERVHLVADTSGSAAFWEMVARGEHPDAPLEAVPFIPGASPTPLTERSPPRPVMPPAELDLLILDLRSELALEADSAEQRRVLSKYHALLLGLGRDWRQLYALHGEEAAGWREYDRLRHTVREQSRLLSAGIIARTNRVAAHRVLEARILRPALTARSTDP